MANFDAIVIGTGLGGLSARALLSALGRSVLVLKQNARIGGCCSTFEQEGFHFDTGASIEEIISPVEKLFHKLAAVPLSIKKTAQVITASSPADGRRWFDYKNFCAKLAEVSLETFFDMPADNMDNLLKIVRSLPDHSRR